MFTTITPFTTEAHVNQKIQEAFGRLEGTKYTISETWAELPSDPNEGDIFELTTNDLPIPPNVIGADPVETGGKYQATDENTWIAKSNKVLYEEILSMLDNKLDKGNYVGTAEDLDDAKEDVSNKKTDIESNKDSNTFYASIKAIYDWAVGKFLDLRLSNLAPDLDETEQNNIKTKLNIGEGGSGGVDLSNYYNQQEVDGLLDDKEDAFTKNTAFNKNFGTGSNDVAEGNHTHEKLEQQRDTIIISGNKFTYIPAMGSDGSSFQLGDIAKDGWINESTFGSILTYKGTGDATLINNWETLKSVKLNN